MTFDTFSELWNYYHSPLLNNFCHLPQKIIMHTCSQFLFHSKLEATLIYSFSPKVCLPRYFYETIQDVVFVGKYFETCQHNFLHQTFIILWTHWCLMANISRVNMLSLNDIVMGIFSDLVAIYISSYHLSIFGFLFLLVEFQVCAQLYLALCNPVDFSLTDSAVHGIFQARILECVAIYHFLFLLDHAFAVLSKKITKSRSFRFSSRYYSKCFIFWLLHLYLWSNGVTCLVECKVCFYVCHFFFKFSHFFFTLWQRSVDYMFMRMFLSFLFYSIDLCVYSFTNISWLLQLFNKSWKQVLGSLQLYSSILCWLFLLFCISTSILESNFQYLQNSSLEFCIESTV